MENSVKAVIDRVVDRRVAVLLVGEEERPFDVLLSKLPKGVKEGDWLKIELVGQELRSAEIDRDETEKRLQRIREKMERLRRKNL